MNSIMKFKCRQWTITTPSENKMYLFIFPTVQFQSITNEILIIIISKTIIISTNFVILKTLHR